MSKDRRQDIRLVRTGSGSTANPEPLMVLDGDILPEDATGSGSHDTGHHYNAYAEASQARVIGRKPYDLTHSAEAGPANGNKERGEFPTAEPAVAERPDGRADVEAKPIESTPPENRLKRGEATVTPRMLKAEEVAAYLSVSVSKVWRLPGKDPDFPSPVRIGGSTRWDRLEVDRYIDSLHDRNHSDC